MKKVLVILMILAFAASASASTVLIGNNPNVSDGGLNMQPPGAWTRVDFVPGGNSGVSLANDRNGPDGGDWNMGGSDGSGSSAPWNVYYYQNFALTPGPYDVDVSGWAKAWAGWWSGEDWGWVQEAHIELWIDGGIVWSGMSSNNTNRDQWTQWSHSGQYNIASNIEMRLRGVKGNDQGGGGTLGAIFFSSRFDDAWLEVDLIPEPGSMMALGAGLMGLAGFVVRRRR